MIMTFILTQNKCDLLRSNIYDSNNNNFSVLYNTFYLFIFHTACYKESGLVWVKSSDERLDEFEILVRGCFLRSEFPKAEIGQCLEVETKASNGTMHNVCACDEKFNCNYAFKTSSTNSIILFTLCVCYWVLNSLG
jgi:hypothetical protein